MSYRQIFNTELKDKLKVAFKKFNTKHKRVVRSKEECFILPPLDTFKEDGVDHINIKNYSKSNLHGLLSMETGLEFYHNVYGKFKTIRGFLDYLTSVEKDDRLRRLQGSNLRDLSSVMTKVKVKDLKFIILDALYQRILQYKDSIDLIKANNLPIDCYYVNKTGVRIRPIYSSWYITGVNVIVKAIKNDEVPDLTFFKDKEDDQDETRIKNVFIYNTVKFYFLNDLLDYKYWLNKPYNRIEIEYYNTLNNKLLSLVFSLSMLTDSEMYKESYENLVMLISKCLDRNQSLSFNYASKVKFDELQLKIDKPEELKDEDTWLNIYEYLVKDLVIDDEKVKNILDSVRETFIMLSNISTMKNTVKVLNHKPLQEDDTIINCYDRFLSIVKKDDYYQEFIKEVREPSDFDFHPDVINYLSPTYNVCKDDLAKYFINKFCNVSSVLLAKMENLEKIVGKERINSVGWVYEFLDKIKKGYGTEEAMDDRDNSIRNEFKSIIDDNTFNNKKDVILHTKRCEEMAIALVILSNLTYRDNNWFEDEKGSEIIVDINKNNETLINFIKDIKVKLNDIIKNTLYS